LSSVADLPSKTNTAASALSPDSATIPAMREVVPAIYSPREQPSRLGIPGRMAASAIAIVCLAPLVTAALLVPNPYGLGTHTALGLAPCGFYSRYGIACPTCGMTTSWAWFARGNLSASLWIQPMGTALAVLAMAGFWGCAYIAVSGRPAHRLIHYLPTGYIGWALLSLTVLAWIWKIFIQLHHLDGWR
jgi:hypothetical protein